MKGHWQSSEEQNLISFQDSRVWQNVFHMKVKSWTWVQSMIFWNFQVHSTPMSSRMLLMGRLTQRGTYRSTKNFLVPWSRQSKTSLCNTSSEVHWERQEKVISILNQSAITSLWVYKLHFILSLLLVVATSTQTRNSCNRVFASLLLICLHMCSSTMQVCLLGKVCWAVCYMMHSMSIITYLPPHPVLREPPQLLELED
jgi:hypothetical protein